MWNWFLGHLKDVSWRNFRTFKQVNMARQEQNTEWTQKISFFIFILHIIYVSKNCLRILVTRQAWNAQASYHMCKQKLLTSSGEDKWVKRTYRIIYVSKIAYVSRRKQTDKKFTKPHTQACIACIHQWRTWNPRSKSGNEPERRVINKVW